MKKTVKLIMATSYAGLLYPWFEDRQHPSFGSSPIVLPDLALPAVPKFSRPALENFSNAYKHRLVATNSFTFNKDKEATPAPDDVCADYCHAFSDANTLHQTSQLVGVGQVWIGKTLMQRLT